MRHYIYYLTALSGGTTSSLKFQKTVLAMPNCRELSSLRYECFTDYAHPVFRRKYQVGQLVELGPLHLHVEKYSVARAYGPQQDKVKK